MLETVEFNGRLQLMAPGQNRRWPWSILSTARPPTAPDHAGEIMVACGILDSGGWSEAARIRHDVKAEELDLDLKQLVRIAQRWWWLLALLPMIAGATVYFMSERQTRQYAATATIRINPPASSALDVNAVRLTQDLTETYRQLIVTWPVLQEVIDTLDLPMAIDELTERTSASAIPSTQLVRISVSDPDPERAALIANTIASTFSSQIADDTIKQIQSTRASVDEQIDAIRAQVTDLDAQIQALDTAGNRNDVAIQAELDDLRNQRARLQQQIADLEVQRETVSLGVASAQTQVTVFEPAIPPPAPYAPRTLLNTALGAAAGLVIAVGFITLLQYFDNSVSDPTNIQEIAGAPVLAAIQSIPMTHPSSNSVYAVSSPQSSSAEAMRLLRANLEFAAAGRQLSTLAITSPGMGEGKSTVSANLAVVLAQAGTKTVLIDADLRRPTQHQIFTIPNDDGLTRLLMHPKEDWRSVGRPVAIPNLTVIPSGPIPPNPADLLSIDRFGELLWSIGQDADIVLIDTPPILAVSDPLVVARQTGAALIVVRAGHTRRDALRHAAEALRQGDIRLLGVVLNRQRAKDGSEYYYAEEPAMRRRRTVFAASR